MSFVRYIKTEGAAKSVWQAFYARYTNIRHPEPYKKEAKGTGAGSGSIAHQAEPQAGSAAVAITTAVQVAPIQESKGTAMPTAPASASAPASVPETELAVRDAKSASVQPVQETKGVSKDASNADPDLVPIQDNPKHTPEFIYFLNNAKKDKLILRSNNQKKLDQCAHALREGNWDDEIFQDPTLPHLAIGLYEDNRITTQQFFTLLEFNQARNEFENIKFHKILDERGEFTEDAKKILLPTLKKPTHSVKLIEDDLEPFRLMLLELPESERIFYTCDIHPDYSYDWGKIGRIMVGTGAALRTEDKLVRVTFGMEDALGLVKFNDEYVRLFLGLGDFTPEDIEYGVRNFFRPGAIDFPYIAVGRTLHGFRNVPRTSATDHDRHHAKISSGTPLDVRRAFWAMIDLFRESFSFHWSKENWDGVDLDYRYAAIQNRGSIPRVLTIEKTTELFCHTLWEGSLTTLSDYSQGGYIFMRDRVYDGAVQSLTPPGAAFFLDVIEHPEKWHKLKIDPKYFTPSFKQAYEQVKTNYELMKKADSIFTLFNCQLYFALRHIHAEAHFPLMSRILWEEMRPKFKLEVAKFTIPQARQLGACEHTIYMKFRGQALNSYPKMLNAVQQALTENGQADYKTAVFDHRLNVDEASEYVAWRRQGADPVTAHYRAQPNFGNWFNQHPYWNGLLACSVVGLPIAYSYEVCCKKKPKMLAAKVEGEETTDSVRRQNDSLVHHRHFGLLRSSAQKNEADIDLELGRTFAV